MKRFILVLLFALLAVASVFCEAITEEPVNNKNTAPAVAAVDEKSGLEMAASYIKAIYDKSTHANPVTRTASDYSVNDIVIIKGVTYSIAWSTDTADAVVGEADENHAVRIAINTKAAAETEYTLTAVITDPADGNTATVEIKHVLPKGKADDLTWEEIVLQAYELAEGEAMTDTARLYGTVTSIPTVYSDQYKNVTVNLQIGNMVDMPIQAYRLKGEGADTLAVGDRITVEGKIKDYKGTKEFDSGCTIVGFGEYPDQSKVVEAIYQLAAGENMAEVQILMGTVTKIDSAWSDQYQNISVFIAPFGAEDYPIEAYRLTGEGAKDIQVGDIITVFGKVKRYKDTFEFDSGCKLIANDCYNSVKTILHAYQLEDGQALAGTRTVTGTITSIPTAYSADYGNITVNIECEGLSDYPVQCYRLTGGADLAVGDTITVSGSIKNYKGTIEFDKNCTYTK